MYEGFRSIDTKISTTTETSSSSSSGSSSGSTLAPSTDATTSIEQVLREAGVVNYHRNEDLIGDDIDEMKASTRASRYAQMCESDQLEVTCPGCNEPFAPGTSSLAINVCFSFSFLSETHDAHPHTHTHSLSLTGTLIFLCTHITLRPFVQYHLDRCLQINHSAGGSQGKTVNAPTRTPASAPASVPVPLSSSPSQAASCFVCGYRFPPHTSNLAINRMCEPLFMLALSHSVVHSSPCMCTQEPLSFSHSVFLLALAHQTMSTVAWKTFDPLLYMTHARMLHMLLY
jgi:hypothetical protein